ncbi:hypothetical protein NSK_006717 [Nannochloropsis salina CCMP1776]|uniref:Ubiquitin carboxyl-terminal hydrolase n=1 Tax=Nannochloropsis salina CCMP1776 TaxID=1027361 RepID=A0A4D9CS17_9STRA|nr:hypothetical protein NSK_006717 [Nannochloropsis salina CCMP1776]|eukprot:TFJ82051.1 hypothetical protein NSK_006717 [Nannochloropsis salina CCMP1776]
MKHRGQQGGSKGGRGTGDVQSFKRLLQGPGNDGAHNGQAWDTGKPRRRIKFHKARKVENGFVSLSTGTTKGPCPASGCLGGVVAGPLTGKKARERFSEGMDKDAAAPGLPTPEKGIFPESKIHPLMTWIRVERVGPGLYNLGNTCFLNATLQCLAYLPPLAQYFLSKKEEESVPSVLSPGAGQGHRGGGQARGGWLGLVRDLIANMHTGPGAGGGDRGDGLARREGGRSPISPKAIVGNLKALNRHFRVGRQEDAHEFLRHLLDALQNGCLQAARVKSNAPGRLAETTFVHRIFGGYLRSQVRCTQCGHCSNTYDNFLDLSLEIHGKVGRLEEALARFTAVETLDRANRWKCPACSQLVCAQKRLSFHTAPNVCTVQLKRFMFGSRSSKLSKNVAYPESLRLSLSGPEGSARYRLAGVLVHAGASVNMGHYYSLVKAANGCWYEMDDAQVRQVGLPTVLRQHAYLLFYVKVGPSPPPALDRRGRDEEEKEGEKRLAKTSPGPGTATTSSGSGQGQRAATPGWSEVLGKLREEDAGNEDHTEGLEGGEGADTAWAQPEGLALFMARAKREAGEGGGPEGGQGNGRNGGSDREEDVGVLQLPAPTNAAPDREEGSAPHTATGPAHSLAPPHSTPEDHPVVSAEGRPPPSTPPSASSTSSSSTGTSAFLPALDVGPVVMSYSYAGKFFLTRFSRRRWHRTFSPWRRHRPGEEEEGRVEGLSLEGAMKKAGGTRRSRRLAGMRQGGKAEEEGGGMGEEERGGGRGSSTGVVDGMLERKGEDAGDSELVASTAALSEASGLPPALSSSSLPVEGKEKRWSREAGLRVLRREEEGVVLVPRGVRTGEKGGRRALDVRALEALRDAPLGAMVGQWEDVESHEQGGAGEVAYAQAARDRVLAQAERTERDEKEKRKLSEFAAAAIAGRKKRVRGARDVSNGDEDERGGKPNPFDLRQQELQKQPRQLNSLRGKGVGMNGRHVYSRVRGKPAQMGNKK